MRILLSSIFALFSLLFHLGCGVSEPAASEANHEVVPGYEIAIKLVGAENSFDKVIDVLVKNGLSVTNIHHIYFADQRQEIRVSVRNGDTNLFNEVEYQLRSVLNVQEFLIRRI